MPMPVMIAMMVMSAAMTAYGAHQQYEAGKEAKKIADENARREEEVAGEEARRRENQLDKDMSEAKARIYASGLDMGGSSEMYMQDLRDTGAEEVAWIHKSGRLRADTMRAEGKLARSQARAGAFQTLAAGASTAGSYF